MAVLTVVT